MCARSSEERENAQGREKESLNYTLPLRKKSARAREGERAREEEAEMKQIYR